MFYLTKEALKLGRESKDNIEKFISSMMLIIGIFIDLISLPIQLILDIIF